MPPLSQVFPSHGILLTPDHSESSLDEAETPIISKKVNQRSRRRVSFEKSPAQIIPGLSVDDCTPEEIAAMWYDADELEEFKKSRKATARRMDKGSVLEDDCTRGLEVKTKAGMKHRHYEILGALNAVLDEQDNQEKNGVINHEAIARIYQMYSRQSGVVARERGVSDEEEAR